MPDTTIESYLKAHDVKPTAVRILVWKEVQGQRETFSLADVERWMPTMERSSIFRALRLFAEHDMLHEVDDGTGQQKYCVCRCATNSHINHIHFTCQHCGKTYCLEDCAIPQVPLPQGFHAKEAEYIVKGLCPNCAEKAL